MKVKSILYETISGSIGTITGAMGLGGAYFKEKPIPTNPQTELQKVVRDAMKAANGAWLALDVSIKELWNIYGKTLIYTNSTGHIVKQTGWTAFNASYVLMIQAGLPIAPLLLSAPLTSGYLTSPSIFTGTDVGRTFYFIGINGPIDMQISTFLSPQEKNTINTNTKGYQYFDNQLMTLGDQMNLDPATMGGRYFIKARRIETNGSMSLEVVLKQDLPML